MSTPVGGDGRVRLSTYVLFVDYRAEVEVQHTVRGSVHRVDRVTYEELLGFQGFRLPAERHRAVDRCRGAGAALPGSARIPRRAPPRHGGAARAGLPRLVLAAGGGGGAGVQAGWGGASSRCRRICSSTRS